MRSDENDRLLTENSRCGPTEATYKRPLAGAAAAAPRRFQDRPKPYAAEDRRLQAGRSLSGGGGGDRLAAIDARWPNGERRDRGIVARRKTAPEGANAGPPRCRRSLRCQG